MPTRRCLRRLVEQAWCAVSPEPFEAFRRQLEAPPNPSDSAEGVVKAYVALASGAVVVAASPGRFRPNRPDPIPVVLLARLAVCRSLQGQGIARALLADALERVLQASAQSGVRGIVVHAASAEARAFYPHLGFDASPADPTMLLLRLADVAATLVT